MHRRLQVLSTMATQPLEDVAKSGQHGPLQLFQLYVIKDRDFCKRLIQRKHTTHLTCRFCGTSDTVFHGHERKQLSLKVLLLTPDEEPCMFCTQQQTAKCCMCHTVTMVADSQGLTISDRKTHELSTRQTQQGKDASAPVDTPFWTLQGQPRLAMLASWSL